MYNKCLYENYRRIIVWDVSRNSVKFFTVDLNNGVCFQSHDSLDRRFVNDQIEYDFIS